MAAALLPRLLLPSPVAILTPNSNCSVLGLRNRKEQWPMQTAASRWRIRVSAESTESALTEQDEQQEGEHSQSEIAQVEETQEQDPQVEETQKQSPQAEQTEATADQLVMMLKAEGSLPDVSIPVVKTTLEGMENVSDVSISSFEGLTSISLTKRTVIQATNVASELVDAMEKGGFRIHTLNLAIDDEE